jgi:hypothetical protein
VPFDKQPNKYLYIPPVKLTVSTFLSKDKNIEN